MHPENDLDARFGSDAARRLAGLLGLPPAGDSSFSPASQDRCRGALLGSVAGEALPAFLVSKRSAVGADTRVTLIAADALLSGVHDHPVRFAARLAATHVRGAGEAIRHTRKALRAGVAWWRAGASNSAGAAAAARSPAFGLLWSGDPARAAWEAALSATVTHGHPAAVAGAAAFAAAIALAAKGKGPLDNRWLADVADICEEYPQGDVYGATVADRIRQIPSIPRADLMDALGEIGPSSLATDAIPAALLGATAAPVPVTAAFRTATNRGLRRIAGLHPCCRAMMGACIGARHGESAWTSWGDTPPPPGIPRDALDRVPGIDAVRTAADRIAGRKVRPVGPRPEPREVGEGDAPVHISFLIDRSGSMSGLKSDVVAGFNGFVAEQQGKRGECALTLVQFDSNDPYEVIHDAVPIEKVPDLTPEQYSPRGMTPLLDALGSLIEAVDARLECLALDADPEGDQEAGYEEDQIVAVFTDGLENASRHWSREELFDAITTRKNDGWTFVFMGANQDSYAEAGRLGLDDGSVQDFRGDKQGVHTAFLSMERAVGEYRGAAEEERMQRRKAFFGGTKEAEEDDRGRGE